MAVNRSTKSVSRLCNLISLSLPSIDLILLRTVISRGNPHVVSSHFVKFISLTSCLTGTFATRTLTGFRPCAIPLTHSSSEKRSAAFRHGTENSSFRVSCFDFHGDCLTYII